MDIFFGTDYHSHLGTRRGGIAMYDSELGFQRAIHNIENSPFRTKFEKDAVVMHGHLGIGCISDTDPQPILMRSHLGVLAVSTVGYINNAQEIIDNFLNDSWKQFTAMSGGRVNTNEIVSAFINQKPTIAEGIRLAQDSIDGSISIVLLTDHSIIAARDKYGRTPVLIGKRDDGYCVSFESFAYRKLEYSDFYELGPGEIVEFGPDSFEVLSKPGNEMKICAFLWTYYGYPNSSYEGINVELMRNRNGEIMARSDMEHGRLPDVDLVAGVPDSGIPHAIGYANESRIPFKRPFVKYTPTWPRSFMPENQEVRNRIAKMKLIPVPELIQGKKMLFLDDSIVRGTQLRETVDFLYECGAAEVHIRSACPPIMFGCKYLNFSRGTSDMELIARRTIQKLEGDEGHNHIAEYSDENSERGCALRKAICDELHFTSLGFQSIDGLIKSIGINPCKICTYCWTGKE